MLFFCYRKGKNDDIQARKNLFNEQEEDILIENQCQSWFANFHIEDLPHCGQQVEADEDIIDAKHGTETFNQRQALMIK